MNDGPRIVQRKHRLPLEAYRGQVCVLYTACTKRRKKALAVPEVAERLTEILSTSLHAHSCISPLYCIMPDHMHVFVKGVDDDSDTRLAMARFKQASGHWAARVGADFAWQGSFFDQIMRHDRSGHDLTRYVLENPVRAGLAASWREWPYLGAVGCSLDETLETLFYD